MKQILSTLVVITTSCFTLLGQGRVSFYNLADYPTNSITIGSLNMGSAGGLAGEGIGGDKYSVQLVWVAGTGFDQASFDAAGPTASTAATGVGNGGSMTAAFFANTGPLANVSGFFDAGIVQIGPVGLYTMQVRAWYNIGSANANYFSARNAGANTGLSSLFTVNVLATPAPINPTLFQAFQVGIPEPSTLTIGGLSAIVFLLFRRKH